jgi:hypothetical protein
LRFRNACGFAGVYAALSAPSGAMARKWSVRAHGS